MQNLFEIYYYEPGVNQLSWEMNDLLLILEGSGNLVRGNTIKSTFLENDYFGHAVTESISLISSEPVKVGRIVQKQQFVKRRTFVHHSGSKGLLFRHAFELGYVLERSNTQRKAASITNVFTILTNLIMDAYDEKHSVSNEKVIHVLRTAYENLADPDFDILAEMRKTNYSDAYIRRLILKETGLSPVRFLNRIRIDKAIHLLTSGQIPLHITDIAHSCGFRDPLYFSKLFKKETGVSPTEYMKQHSHLL